MPSTVPVGPARSHQARAHHLTQKRAGVPLMCVVFFLCLAFPVAGQAERRILSAASSLNGMLSLFPKTGTTRNLRLNGAEVMLRSSGTNESLSSVVHRLRAACGRVDWRVDQRSEPQPRPKDALGPEGSVLPIPIWQVQSKSEAFVACVTPAAPLTLSGLRRMSGRFQASSDLAAWGSFGFAHAVRTSDRTSVLVASTGQTLDLPRMFPASGDAPGSDLPLLPRPAGRRTLSVSLDESPMLAAYATQRPPLAAISSYAEQLEMAGFAVKRQDDQKGALIARGSGITALVTVSPAASSKQTSKSSTLMLAILPR